MTMIPRFTIVTALLGIVSLGMAGFLSWYIVTSQDAEDQKACQRVVAARNDSRAMWLYLLKAQGGENPKRAAVFAVKLNELLPALKCDESGNWAPVE